MQWDPLSSEMPQIQSPLEPSSFLICTYRDVAAEHHKGAAYQHRCYLVCLFHREVRTPPYTHTHTSITGYGSRTFPLGKLNMKTSFPWNICHLLNIYMGIREKKLSYALRYICPANSTNCLIDVDFYRTNMLFEGFLNAAFSKQINPVAV